MTESRFDRILVAVESSAPVGSTGMDPLKTDPLMSLEGIQALLDRLAPGGWLAVHRFLLPPPRGEMRLLATVIEVMRLKGWQAEQKLGVFRSLSTLMVLVSREAWTPEDSKRFSEFCLSRGFAPVYYPGMPETERNTGIRLPEPVYAQECRNCWQILRLFMQGPLLIWNRFPMTVPILISSSTGLICMKLVRISMASGKA